MLLRSIDFYFGIVLVRFFKLNLKITFTKIFKIKYGFRLKNFWVQNMTSANVMKPIVVMADSARVVADVINGQKIQMESAKVGMMRERNNLYALLRSTYNVNI